jgi:molybdopterin biosynthesis enzyme
MITYIGTLKKGVKYDKALKSYLKENNIEVVKHLKKLKVLIIQTEKEISPEVHQYFEILEKERINFSI